MKNLEIGTLTCTSKRSFVLLHYWPLLVAVYLEEFTM